MFKVISNGTKMTNDTTDAVSAEIVRNQGKWDIVLITLDKKAVYKTFSHKEDAVAQMHELRYCLNVMLKIMPTEEK